MCIRDRAPIEIRSTPVSAMARTLARVMPPEASRSGNGAAPDGRPASASGGAGPGGPAWRLRRATASARSSGAMLSSRTRSAPASIASRSCASVSHSTWIGIAAPRPAAAGRGAAMPIQVECETLAQLREAIEAGADRVLLDNMAPDDLAEAVALRNRQAGPPGPAPPDADAGLPSGAAPFPLLEASGGITLANVRAIAETGVDLISIGAITHSAPALDLSLLIDSR